jgi:hypothetical protein
MWRKNIVYVGFSTIHGVRQVGARPPLGGLGVYPLWIRGDYCSIEVQKLSCSSLCLGRTTKFGVFPSWSFSCIHVVVFYVSDGEHHLELE